MFLNGECFRSNLNAARVTDSFIRRPTAHVAKMSRMFFAEDASFDMSDHIVLLLHWMLCAELSFRISWNFHSSSQSKSLTVRIKQIGGFKHSNGGSTMSEAIFDIFSGVPNGKAIWIESAPGLSNAKERMSQIAASNPGRYFISSIGTRSPLAQIETVGRFQASQSSPKRTSTCSAASDF